MASLSTLVELTVRIYCAGCGNELAERSVEERHGEHRIHVGRCDHCMEAAREQGRDEVECKP